jgi:hypothetical protein
MKRRDVLRFALWSGVSGLIVALLLTPLALGRGTLAVQWGLVGWFLTTLAGVGGGAWVVSQHGRSGVGFVLALGVCMLSRLILFVAGPFAAAPLGTEAVWACVVGLFAGYLPAQATEVIWFARSTIRAG